MRLQGFRGFSIEPEPQLGRCFFLNGLLFGFHESLAYLAFVGGEHLKLQTFT